MAARFVAAIDHGTSSTRCILFDARGVPVATAQRAQTMHYPRPGWVELDMGEVWQHTQECIHEALKSAGASPADVAGIGITNERETVVLWDRRTGRPVAPAITWQDTRTAAAARDRVLVRVRRVACKLHDDTSLAGPDGRGRAR